MHYRVGSIDVDPGNYHLSENGDPVAVEPKVFDLIVYLIRNRDRLVTRQELFDRIWQGRVVTDTSLSNHIKSARKVLGDDGQKQEVIKTIHGRGYQFIADAEEVDEKTRAPGKPGTVHSHDADKSIAVLAFSDLSPERDQEYFSDGLSEELINLLAKIPDLRVISRTSSFSFKDKNTSTQEIGSRLNVTHILEGSVRKSGDRLRITTQLIKVSDESHLWSGTFDETMGDVFRIQDDIAQAVIKQLKVTLLGAADKSTDVNPDAYTLFLRAKYFYHKVTPETVGMAEKLIKESIAIDPRYAPSWELLSSIILRDTVYFVSRPNKEGIGQAMSALEKSLELDSEFARSYATLAGIDLSRWESDAANYNINKALLLDNTDIHVLNVASIVALHSGRIDDAIAYLQRAIKLDPLEAVHYYNLSLDYLFLGRLDEATEAIKQCELLEPDSANQHALKAWIMLAQGKYEMALEEAEKEPYELFKLFVKNVILFYLGAKTESERLLAQFIEQYGANAPTYVALVYAARMDNDPAFEWLEKAFQQQDPDLRAGISYYFFRYIWSDPRWGAFLDKLGLPEGHWLIQGM